MSIHRASLLALTVLCASPPAAHAQSRDVETLFYMRNNEPAFESFRNNIDKVSIVGPQVYSVEGDGVVWGEVDPRVLALAQEHGVKVMPLIHNPGFNQETIHDLLHDPEARRRSIDMMVELADRHGYWGWQFDFENFHITDRDAMTVYYREAAEALHANGFTISIAVVPSLGIAGRSPFHRYMEANWRGTFDLEAIAEVSDFISYMTYAQHGGPTTPGPIAGLPWMRATLDYAISQGVPQEKISLGIPTFSGYWFPTYANGLARVQGHEAHWDRATALIAQNDAGSRLAWIEEQGVYYTWWENSGTFEWVFLENARTFETKLGLLDEYPGLRGISVWVLSAEDPETWETLRPVRR